MSTKLYDYIKPWLCSTTEGVLKAFAGLPNAIDVGHGLERYVYVPGTRKDKVLLVAHSDTVWNRGNAKIHPVLTSDQKVIVSGKNGIGIGADDRAGCAMLWLLRNLGHSLLIPNGEECGGVGSSFLMDDPNMASIVQSHQFAIEFDRMNDKDLVFYSVGTVSFKDFLEEKLPGYKQDVGSYTDISTLCTDICGVNMSIGYYYQHSQHECLNLSEWNKSYKAVKKLLEMEDIPRFPLSGPKVSRIKKIRYKQSDFEKFNKPKEKVTTTGNNTNPFVPRSCSTLPSPNLEDYEEIDVDALAIEDMIEAIFVCSDCFGSCMIYEPQLTGKCPFCQVPANV